MIKNGELLYSRQHPHKLVGRNCANGICYIPEFHTDRKDPTILTFPELRIQSCRIPEIPSRLAERASFNINPFDLSACGEDDLKRDIHKVRLCFQVIYCPDPQNRAHRAQFEPIVSQPITNNKAAADIKIHDISDTCSPASGGKKIMIFCNKIAKEDIEVRFYEEDAKKEQTLIGLGAFQPNNVHRDVAIAFKTPKYCLTTVGGKSPRIFIEMVRPSDNARSNRIPFQYVPDANDVDAVRLRKQRKVEKSEDLLEFLSSGEFRQQHRLSLHQHNLSQHEQNWSQKVQNIQQQRHNLPQYQINFPQHQCNLSQKLQNIQLQHNVTQQKHNLLQQDVPHQQCNIPQQQHNIPQQQHTLPQQQHTLPQQQHNLVQLQNNLPQPQHNVPQQLHNLQQQQNLRQQQNFPQQQNLLQQQNLPQQQSRTQPQNPSEQSSHQFSITQQYNENLPQPHLPQDQFNPQLHYNQHTPNDLRQQQQTYVPQQPNDDEKLLNIERDLCYYLYEDISPTYTQDDQLML